MPEFEFKGRQLQQLGLCEPAQQIALNVTQLGASTCVGFGRFGGPETPAGMLVESFRAIPDEGKANAVLVLDLEHLEIFSARRSGGRHYPQTSVLGFTKRLP